ncbi:MAG: S8 family serine peptidase [Crocinitomix sp.]|nr:S8 family serine peptidase [Crocinitomix sp.]
MRYLLILLLSFASFLSHGQNLAYEADEIIVQLAPTINSSAFIRKFEAQEHLEIVSFEQLSEPVNIYLIKFHDQSLDLDHTIRLLYGYSEIRIAQKNHFVSDRETIPTDALFATQWHLKNTGLDGGDIDADIDATDAWDVTTGGLTTHSDTIVVCIIEGGGVDINHEDIAGNIWKNFGEIPDDGIDNDGNGYVDDFDGWNVQTEDDAIGFGSHGTRVSGMVGASGNNGIGVSGVNWNVKMMVVKGQQASNEATVIAAYSYPLKMRKLYNETFGAEGAFVVVTNASWGIDGGDPADSPLWCAMYDSLGMHGILSVGATTNNNLNVEEVGDLPTNCTSEFFIGVTMTNNVDVRAGSGYGTTSVDLAAPGSSVRLTVPGDLYSTTSGTSFATPCVTGAIALAYSAPCAEFINFVKYDPAAAALQMRQYLFDGVDELDALVDDVATGGRLNVNNTIQLIMDECDDDACISPYNMRANDITDTSVTIAWDGFTGDYILTILPEGGIATEITIEGSTVLSFDTLMPCTNYTITLQSICEGDILSDDSFPLYFITDGCCTNPILANPTKTETNLTITWNEILYATQYDFRYSISGEDDWTELTDVTSPLLIEDLEKCTEYDFQIYTLCADSTRGYSESYVFRTLGCGVCIELDYCPVIGADITYEWIDSVKVNGYANQTGKNDGWLRSEQIITALTPGETYQIRVVPDFSGGTFSERYSIYIDFNQNGEFDLPAEAVVDDILVSGGLTQDITIPLDAAIGVTKIRIGMAALSDPEACPTSSFFGEYEDYCLYIGPQLTILENELELSIYPNPANQELFIKSNVEIEQINIYSNDGKLVLNETNYNANPLNIAFLSSGIYIIQVETADGIINKKFVKQ